jgi:hypothetical protein
MDRWTEWDGIGYGKRGIRVDQIGNVTVIREK